MRQYETILFVAAQGIRPPSGRSCNPNGTRPSCRSPGSGPAIPPGDVRRGNPGSLAAFDPEFHAGCSPPDVRPPAPLLPSGRAQQQALVGGEQVEQLFDAIG